MTVTATQEIVRILLSIVGALVATVGFLSWRTVARMENKLDKFMESCRLNHDSLIDKFPSRIEWEAWKGGRDDIKKEQIEIWEAVNSHSHDKNGRVIRNG